MRISVAMIFAVTATCWLSAVSPSDLVIGVVCDASHDLYCASDLRVSASELRCPGYDLRGCPIDDHICRTNYFASAPVRYAAPTTTSYSAPAAYASAPVSYAAPTTTIATAPATTTYAAPATYAAARVCYSAPHVRGHTHTYAHAHTYARMHARARTHTHMRASPHTHKHTHTHHPTS